MSYASRHEAAIIASFGIPPMSLGARCKGCRAVAVVDAAGYCSWCGPDAQPVRYDEHGPVTPYAPIITGRGRWRCWCGRRFWTWRGYEAHWRQVRASLEG